ncbi:hypothetical protein, partial [Hymenobacter crusticola]
PFAGAEEWLVDLIHSDHNVHVQRYALLSLAHIRVERAVALAQGFLQAHHADEYMIIASMDIVAAYNQALLRPYYATLRQHSSDYVRQRVPES